MEVFMWKILLMLYPGFVFIPSLAERLEVSAFDYHRKFGYHMMIGECPYRYVATSKGFSETVACNWSTKGTVHQINNPMKTRMIVSIERPEDIFTKMGKCDGKMASYLGLLVDGDCTVVNIAKSLSYDNYTYTFGLIEFHRAGVDILRANPRESKHPDTYYVADISYGTLEAILVTIRYEDIKNCQRAKAIGLRKASVADDLQRILKASQGHKFVKVLRFSSAEHLIDEKMFSLPIMPMARKHILNEEDTISLIADRVLARDKFMNHHVIYGLVSPRTKHVRKEEDPVWDEVTAYEVLLSARVVHMENVYQDMCAMTPKESKWCKRLLKHTNRSKLLIKRLHTGRSRWYESKYRQQGRLAGSIQTWLMNLLPKIDNVLNKLKRMENNIPTADQLIQEPNKCKNKRKFGKYCKQTKPRPAGKGKPGKGNPGRGSPGKGTPGRGNSGRGNPGRGNAGRGNPGRGNSGKGNSGRGNSGKGRTGRRIPGKGKKIGHRRPKSHQKVQSKGQNIANQRRKSNIDKFELKLKTDIINASSNENKKVQKS